MPDYDELFGFAYLYLLGRRGFDDLYLIALRDLPGFLHEDRESAATQLASLVVDADAQRGAGEIAEDDILSLVADFLGKPQDRLIKQDTAPIKSESTSPKIAISA